MHEKEIIIEGKRITILRWEKNGWRKISKREILEGERHFGTIKKILDSWENFYLTQRRFYIVK